VENEKKQFSSSTVLKCFSSCLKVYMVCQGQVTMFKEDNHNSYLNVPALLLRTLVSMSLQSSPAA